MNFTIPKLKKLESKYKKEETVYFSLKEHGVLKGKIIFVHRYISESRGCNILTIGDYRTIKTPKRRISYDVMYPAKYNIKTKNGNVYHNVEEYQIFKKEKLAINNWMNFYFKPIEKNYHNLITIKQNLEK